MPLQCYVLPKDKLLMVEGSASVTRSDIESCLESPIAQRVKNFGKLIDLRQCVLDLDRQGLDAIARAIISYADGQDVGPVAMVAASVFNIDMMVLLKQRIGPRPFRIFVNDDLALAWLQSFGVEEARPQPPKFGIVMSSQG
jgi:hypothetical protein